MNEFEWTDLALVCTDCGIDFVWTAEAQRFFAERQFKPPKRCKPCAAAKRHEVQARRDGQ